MRAAAAIANDIRLQVRYGLYAVSVAMVLLWGVLLGALTRHTPLSTALLVPAFVALNTIITTFYFMAGLVLFEKSEGVLPALATSPLTPAGYLLSKTLSLALLAMAETLLIVGFLFGMRAVTLRLLLGALLLGVFYALAGFLAVVRFDSINQFLMPSVPIVTFLLIPLLAHFDLVRGALVAWHPAHPVLLLMRGGGWMAPLVAAGWCAMALYFACKDFERFVARA
jgi:fluoroquinolone transport system permease protein